MMANPKTGPINVLVNEQRPFPGLAAFTEAEARFFHGRRQEAAELYRLTRRAVATVLFGSSGLGKTSLLQAGLFPILRRRRLQQRFVMPPKTSEWRLNTTVPGLIRMAIRRCGSFFTAPHCGAG